MFISARAAGLTVSVRSPPPAAEVTGISFIPQSGQFPGRGWRICGCIEQVHIVVSATVFGAGFSFSGAIDSDEPGCDRRQ